MKIHEIIMVVVSCCVKCELFNFLYKVVFERLTSENLGQYYLDSLEAWLLECGRKEVDYEVIECAGYELEGRVQRELRDSTLKSLIGSMGPEVYHFILTTYSQTLQKEEEQALRWTELLIRKVREEAVKEEESD